MSDPDAGKKTEKMKGAKKANSGDGGSDPFDEDALGKAYDTRILVRLWPYVLPYWRQVAMTLLLFLPIFVLELAPAWIVKSGIDRVVASAAAASAMAATLTADGAVVLVAAAACLCLRRQHCCVCQLRAVPPLNETAFRSAPLDWRRGGMPT